MPYGTKPSKFRLTEDDKRLIADIRNAYGLASDAETLRHALRTVHGMIPPPQEKKSKKKG